MSDLGTFVTEYFVTAPTDEPGITELQRYAGPYIKAAGFGEAREIAERLTIARLKHRSHSAPVATSTPSRSTTNFTAPPGAAAGRAG